MPSTAILNLIGTLTGAPEGGADRFSMQLSNSSGVGSVTITTATTAGSSGSVAVTPTTAAKFLIVIPTATNTVPIRVTHTTASSNLGLSLSSRDPSLLAIGVDSTFRFYTTGTTGIPLRVIAY